MRRTAERGVGDWDCSLLRPRPVKGPALLCHAGGLPRNNTRAEPHRADRITRRFLYRRATLVLSKGYADSVRDGRCQGVMHYFSRTRLQRRSLMFLRRLVFAATALGASLGLLHATLGSVQADGDGEWWLSDAARIFQPAGPVNESPFQLTIDFLTSGSNPVHWADSQAPVEICTHQH